MSVSLQYTNIFGSKSNHYLILLLSVLFLGVTLLLVYFELSIFLIPILLAFPLAYLVIKKPKAWLYLLNVFAGIFFHTASDGVTVVDLMLGVYLIGSVILWFAYKLFVKKEKVVRNKGDWLLLTFFLLLPFNLFIAILNDTAPEMWIREYTIMFIMLLYFPIRDIIKTEKDFQQYLLFAAFVILCVGIYQLYDYYIRITVRIVYAYEMAHTMNANQTLYTASSVVGLIFLIMTNDIKLKIFSLIFAASSIFFLITTFSRTFWLILILSTIVFFIIIPMQKKIRMAVYMSFIISFMSIVSFIFLKDNVTILYEVVKKRLFSAGKLTKDMSLYARLVEWELINQKILENPLGGYGLAKKFHFYDPITLKTLHTSVVHNGYLHIIFRIGIPLSLFYFSFLLFYLFKAINLIPKARSDIHKSVSFSAIGLFLTLLLANSTGPIFFYRDGLFVTAMVISFICILENLINSNIISKNGN